MNNFFLFFSLFFSFLAKLIKFALLDEQIFPNFFPIFYFLAKLVKFALLDEQIFPNFSQIFLGVKEATKFLSQKNHCSKVSRFSDFFNNLQFLVVLYFRNQTTFCFFSFL
jgi:hypothetical protein